MLLKRPLIRQLLIMPLHLMPRAAIIYRRAQMHARERAKSFMRRHMLRQQRRCAHAAPRVLGVPTLII